MFRETDPEIITFAKLTGIEPREARRLGDLATLLYNAERVFPPLKVTSHAETLLKAIRLELWETAKLRGFTDILMDRDSPLAVAIENEWFDLPIQE
jgi:hypothetical protein